MFRFTMRDLLWLMVVVAVLAAWLHDRDISLSRLMFVHDDMTKQQLRVGEKMEFELLKNGEVSQRIVPATPPSP
jgi:hypothetical protein